MKIEIKKKDPVHKLIKEIHEEIERFSVKYFHEEEKHIEKIVLDCTEQEARELDSLPEVTAKRRISPREFTGKIYHAGIGYTVYIRMSI